MTPEQRVQELESFIAEALPFLREAWTACFRGQEKKLLSAEERGMGELFKKFQAIANGMPALPPGVITEEEAGQRVERSLEWAHTLLGEPNELAEPLRQYMRPGQTCADGLRAAHAELKRLKKEVRHLFSLPNWENRCGEWQDIKDALRRLHNVVD